MNKTLLCGLALVPLLVCGAQAAPIDYALTSQGATLLHVSSFITGSGVDDSTMEADLLTNTKTAWFGDGDTRYIFGANDVNQSILIDLGSNRLIDTIGASIDRPEDGDRPVLGPVTIMTSTDDVVFTPWGGPVLVTNPMVDPISISSAPENVRYISYAFGPGPIGGYFGGFGGSAINSIFADATPVPEPLTLSIFGAGLVGAAFVRRRKVKA